MIKMEETYYCDFCGKSQHEVEKVVAGPDSIGICDECVALASDICGKAMAEVVEQNREWIDQVRDAERYRALRAVPINELSHVRVVVSLSGQINPTIATYEVIDAAADLLIAQQREKPNGL